ncbi:putative histone acetyltransferase chromatin regulator PHD family [Dioscorea sansibarensis]
MDWSRSSEVTDNNHWLIEQANNENHGNSWLVVEFEAEECSQAITLYSNRLLKAEKLDCEYGDLKLKVKKHLAYLGWVIEVKRDTTSKFRYTSPDGKVFYSLNLVCCSFVEKNQIRVAKINSKSLHCKRKHSSLNELVAEDLPGAIRDYCDYIDALERKGRKEVPNLNVKLLRLKAKRHLLFAGWSIQMIAKKTKEELCYFSPNGKSFHSLRVACKAYLEELPESGGPSCGRDLIKRRKLVKKNVEDVSFVVPSRLRKSCRRKSLLLSQKQLMHTSEVNDFLHPRLKCDYSQSPSDDICSICQEDGTLVLCDHCPSAFHLECIGLEVIPEGKWFCPCCRCGICGMSDFNSDTKQFTERTIMYCDQCEREFHVGCLRESGVSGLTNCPTRDWFCSEKCSKVFFHLQKLLGKSNQTSVRGISWALFRSSSANGAEDVNVKLHDAIDVLHECFVTILEPRTNSDISADLIFNRRSELKRLNFPGFYTMVLQKRNELISVASFRVFGDKVAEMPLIGTRVKYRQQGMCRLLVNELEKLLSSLGVKMLVLPAIPQLVQTWTTRFGFTKMSNSDRLKLKDYMFLNFHDSTMCYKFLAGNENRLTSNETNNADNASVEVLYILTVLHLVRSKFRIL